MCVCVCGGGGVRDSETRWGQELSLFFSLEYNGIFLETEAKKMKLSFTKLNELKATCKRQSDLRNKSRSS